MAVQSGDEYQKLLLPLLLMTPILYRPILAVLMLIACGGSWCGARYCVDGGVIVMVVGGDSVVPCGRWKKRGRRWMTMKLS